MAEPGENGRELAYRVAAAFFPTVVTANLLGVWLPKPIAWAISVVAWNVAIYLIPPRPTMSIKRWLIIVLAIASVGVLVAIFEPTLLIAKPTPFFNLKSSSLTTLEVPREDQFLSLLPNDPSYVGMCGARVLDAGSGSDIRKGNKHFQDTGI